MENIENLKERFIAFFRQDRLLALAAMLLPVLFGGFFVFDTSTHRKIIYLFEVLTVALLVRDRREVIAAIQEQKTFWILLLAFLTYMTASVFWSMTDEHGRMFGKAKLLLLIALPMLASFYMFRKVPDVARWSVVSLGAVAAVTALYLLSAGDYYNKDVFVRLHGFGRAENPVQAGFLYALAFLATLSLKTQSRKALAVKLLVLVICAVAIAVANSRGALLALAATLSLYGLLKTNLSLKTMAGIGAGIVIVVGAVLWSVLGQIEDTTFFQRADTGRFEVWQQGWAIFQDAPLLGHGLASKFHYTFILPQNGMEATVGHPHSLYLSTLIQGGAIGLSLFLALFGYALWKAYLLHKTRNISWPLLFMVCGGVFGIFDFGGYVINLSTEWLAFWWPAVISIALVNREIPKGKDNDFE